MQVEKVTNDVLMTWRGAHRGLAPAYFADEDIFETSGDFEKKKSASIAHRAGAHLIMLLAWPTDSASDSPVGATTWPEWSTSRWVCSARNRSPKGRMSL